MKNKPTIKATICFYAPGRVGRQSVPVGDGYPPHLRVHGIKELFGGVRVKGLPVGAQHEANYDVQLELLYHPTVDYSPLMQGTKFEILEGATRVVGEGTVLSSFQTEAE